MNLDKVVFIEICSMISLFTIHGCFFMNVLLYDFHELMSL